MHPIYFLDCDSPHYVDGDYSVSPWHAADFPVAAAGPRQEQGEADLDTALSWLRKNDLLPEGTILDTHAKRRYMALSGGTYGDLLTPA
jgi:hypothetical protein